MTTIYILIAVFGYVGIAVAGGFYLKRWERKHGISAWRMNGRRSSYRRNNKTKNNFLEDDLDTQRQRSDLDTPFGLESSVYRDDDAFTDSSGWPLSDDD